MAISNISSCSNCGIDAQTLRDNSHAKKQQEVQKLKQRDIEVRAHESAHLAAAGQYSTGGASFKYITGPDGKRYAVGGEVKIDTSPVRNDPQATIQKARQIRSAAMAPANPSAQDRAVAAKATKMEMEAQMQLAQEESEKTNGYDKNGKMLKTKSEFVTIDFIV